MIYIAKPSFANNSGLKEFSDAVAAIKYLASYGVITCGKTLEEKIEELGWIEKLEVNKGCYENT